MTQPRISGTQLVGLLNDNGGGGYVSNSDSDMRDPYPDDLRALAELLNQNADRARRRGVYGLEGKLREAAESASSWARGLELEERD